MTTFRKAVLAVIGVFAVVTAAAVVYLWTVPIDLTPHLPRIKTMIEARVAGKVEMKRLVVKALPAPDILIEGLSTTMNGKPIFVARRVHVKVSAWPLLAGHVVLEDIELDGADVFVDRDKTGTVNVLEFLKENKKIRESRKHKFSFALAAMDIKDTRVEITDRQPPTPVSFNVDGIKGLIKDTPRGVIMEGRARLAPDTDFTFSANEAHGELKGAGSLKRLRLERFSPYVAQSFKGGSVTGTADLEFTYTGGGAKVLDGTLKYDSVAVSVPELISRPVTSRMGSVSISIHPAQGGTGLALEGSDMVLDADKFAVMGGFRLSSEGDKTGLDLDLSTTPMDITYIKEYVPKGVFKGETADRAMAVQPIEGTITVKSLRAFVPLGGEHGKTMLDGLTARAALEGSSFAYPGLSMPVRDVSADITYANKALNVTGLKGRYGKEELTGLDAKVAGLPASPAYEVTARLGLDVNESLSIAGGLAGKKTPFGRTLSGFIAKTEARGALYVNAVAKGTVKGGLKSLKYSGRALLKDGSLSYRTSALSLSPVNAAAEFDNNTIEIKSLSAREGASTLSLSGSVIDYPKKTRRFSAKASGVIDSKTLKRAVAGKPIEKEADFDGVIPFSLSAEGMGGEFEAAASIDGTRARLKFADLMDKPSGERFSVEIAGSRNKDSIAIKNASVSFGRSSSANVTGSVTPDFSAYDLTFRSAGVQFADIGRVSAYFIKDFESSGLVTFDVRAQKKSAKGPRAYTGAIDVKDARFETTFVPKPVEDITASARFFDNGAKIILESLSIGKTRLKGQLEITDMARRKFNFELESPALYTSDIYAKKPKDEEAKPETPETEPETTPERPLSGHGTIDIEQGEAFGQPFSGLHAEVTAGPKAVRIEPVRLTLDKGRAVGSFTWYIPHTHPKVFDLSFRLNELDLETMLTGFGAKKEYLAGRFKSTVNLAAMRGAVPLTAGLEGTADFESEKGRMWKIPVIDDIFSIVNILSIDELFNKGLPYKTLSGDFAVNKGVITTKNVEMASDTMRMSAVGEISVPGSKMDVVVAMRPFVTFDKIVSSIPIAGWLITGKEESTVSMYFKVKGALSDPDVSPMPIEGIGKGVFGILQRLLEAPAELLKGTGGQNGNNSQAK